MKKLAVFSLLAIFLFNSVGYFIVFKIAQTEVRKEIKTRLKLTVPQAELIAIEINKSDIKNIHWEKENKEFYYSDHLFDVVKTKETPNSIIYYCIDDKKERNLFASLDDHVTSFIASENSKKNSPTKKLNDHVVKIYFSNSYGFGFQNASTQVYFSFSTRIYLSEFQETKSPPPEFV